MNTESSIKQCDQCKAALTEGYCEITTALEEKRVRLCFSCAREEMALKRALEEDDRLRDGGEA